LAESILNHFGRKISAITLIPSSSGAFEIITDDGRILHSKLKSGLFPDDEMLIAGISSILAGD